MIREKETSHAGHDEIGAMNRSREKIESWISSPCQPKIPAWRNPKSTFRKNPQLRKTDPQITRKEPQSKTFLVDHNFPAPSLIHQLVPFLRTASNLVPTGVVSARTLQSTSPSLCRPFRYVSPLLTIVGRILENAVQGENVLLKPENAEEKSRQNFV